MRGSYSIEEGEFGSRLVLHSNWQDEFADIMHGHSISELMVNYALGFTGDDLDFLQEIPHLKGLVIIHRTIDDISKIHVLHNLRSLTVHTYCKTPIDFSCFPQLERCILEWRADVSGIFQLPVLAELWLNAYDKKHTKEFSQLKNLQKLSLANAPVQSLAGLASLERLKFLGLYRLRRLQSLDGIQWLRGLVALELQECRRVDSLEQVGRLHELRRLLFVDMGKVRSAKFLEDLREIEELLFYGTTNVEDGDLSILVRLPNLKNVSFQNRRHYSHKREQIPGH